MKTHAALTAALLLFSLPARADDAASPAGEQPGAVYYQIYVRAFYDSDGDGIGDLQGVIRKLDYLGGLGIRGIWLMPLFRAPSEHKYFASDFNIVDPEYGTNDDLRQLVHEAHRRNMRVIIDFMVNHTAATHPWFEASTRECIQQAAGREPSRPPKHLHFYHWAKDGNLKIETPETYTREGRFDESRLQYWKEDRNITGEPVGRYYSRFVDAPDLNYANPAVREEIKRVGKFWLADVGVDGFRLDAARHIFDCENAKVLDKADRNSVWWTEFCRAMKAARPDCLLIGEIWSTPEVMASYLQTGMDSVYDFALARAIVDSVRADKERGVVKTVLEMNRLCNAGGAVFVDSTFLSNHDFPRLMTMLKDDEAKVRLAASLLLTLPGRPFIYYGDELGLKCDKHLEWLAMPWDDEGKEPGQTAWMCPDKQFAEGIRPVAVQSRDETSLYWHFRRLIRLRNESPALGSGRIAAAAIDNPQIVSFFRTSGEDDLLVVHNLSNDVRTANLPESCKAHRKLVYQSAGQPAMSAPQVLSVSAFGTVILSKQ